MGHPAPPQAPRTRGGADSFRGQIGRRSSAEVTSASTQTELTLSATRALRRDRQRHQQTPCWRRSTDLRCAGDSGRITSAGLPQEGGRCSRFGAPDQARNWVCQKSVGWGAGIVNASDQIAGIVS